MAATITDVAKAAGVSKATVSKFVNGTHYVSQETKERIAAAISDSAMRRTGWRRA